MAFDPRQFKQKKKRAVDPNAPPRPNLMSHDKTIRESQIAFNQLSAIVQRQAEEIESMKHKYRDMQQSINQLINYVRQRR